jgi:hypothetical protein
MLNDQQPQQIDSPLHFDTSLNDVLSTNRVVINKTDQHGAVTPDATCITDGSLGIDKYAFTVPIDKNIDLNAFKRRLLGNDNLWSANINIPGFPQIHVRPMTDYLIPQIRIEFNPSLITRAQGYFLCPIGMLQEVTKSVIKAVLAFGHPAARPSFMVDSTTGLIYEDYPSDWTSQIINSRIDVARDFFINDPDFSLSQLSHVKPKHARATVAFTNGNQLNTLTHTADPKSIKSKIYNKSAQGLTARQLQVKSRAHDTHYRFEISIPRDQARKKGLNSLADIDTPDIVSILHKRWTMSNYHSNLIKSGQSLIDLHRHFPAGRANELFGAAEAIYAQIEDNYTDTEYAGIRADLKTVNINPHKAIQSQGTPYGALDFSTGNIFYY